MDETNGSLKPYLTASAGVHAAVVIALALLAGRTVSASNKVYRIDFIGDTGTILNRNVTTSAGGAAAKPAPAPKPPKPLGRPTLAPMRDPDAVSLGKPSFATSKLKPSFLNPRSKPEPKTPAAEPAPAAQASAEPAAEPAAQPGAGSGTGTGEAAGPGSGSAAISADMPDFPYPWYLQRLRATLWNRWSSHMPAGPAECGVVFTVMQDGKVVDLKVETTSGDGAYDLAALTTVKDTAPFPPLPPQFQERFLKVHVQFRSQ